MEENSLKSLKFSLYGSDEMERAGVVKIENSSTYDRGNPKELGLMDSRMGVFDRQVTCPTCGINGCDHHYGVIELCLPVFRHMSTQLLINILRCVCIGCSAPKFQPGEFFTNLTGKNRVRLFSELCTNRLVCSVCTCPQPKYKKINKIFIERTYKQKDLDAMDKEEQEWAMQPLTISKIQHILCSVDTWVWEELGFNPSQSNPQNILIERLLVPPPSIRPFAGAGGTDIKRRRDNDLTIIFQDIMRCNIELKTAIHEKNQEGIQQHWNMLHLNVASLTNHGLKRDVDIKGNLTKHAKANAKKTAIDMKKRLCGKRGRLRGNLCGRRVDHSSRTVVGGDTHHDIWQLGVPSLIMNTLTFPERVNSLNYKQLQACVRRGANKDNGASAIFEEETQRDLSMMDAETLDVFATNLQIGWIVERHLHDGDWVLFNRQPSLHKESINALKIYRVQSNQFKLPLPLTTAYNADFDGDEMVLHALQSYEAIAEAQELLSVPHQMVSPQSSSVLTALVQDALDGSYKLTDDNTLLTKAEAMNLVMNIHYDSQVDYSDIPTCNNFTPFLPPPAICKPERWTGKQIYSLLFPKNLNITKQVKNNLVVIQHGQLLQGRLCKGTVGRCGGGVVHRIWNDCGPWAAAKFVSDAQRLSIDWLLHDSVSISIQDIVLPISGQVEATLQQTLEKTIALRKDITNPIDREGKQMMCMQECLQTIGDSILTTMDPTKGTSIVTACGAKGNILNLTQMAGIVGQQTVGGKRVGVHASNLGDRTLPNFIPGDESVESRGFVKSSYIKGLSPHEVFFSQMGGREGIVATAVNTAESGYGQRRMVKGQESQTLAYDGTVRVANNAIVQFHYGNDDYDATKLELVNMESLLQGSNEYMLREKIRTVILENGDPNFQMPVNFKSMFNQNRPYTFNIQKLLDFLIQIKNIHEDFKGIPRTTYHSMHQILHTGDFEDDPSYVFRIYAASSCLTSRNTSVVTQALHTYRKCLVNHGEGVGAIGATSIGEPATQMVLNTFHYSGNASTNVTITGLPRAKELITAADSASTANMLVREDNLECLQPKIIRDVCRLSCEPSTPKKKQFHDNACIKGDLENCLITKLSVLQGIAKSVLLKKKRKLKLSLNSTLSSLAIRITGKITATMYSKILNFVGSDCYMEYTKDLVLTPVSWQAMDVPDALLCSSILELLADYKVQGVKDIVTAQKIFVFDMVIEQSFTKVKRNCIETLGSNLLEITDLPSFDTCYSNNVQEVTRVLGIEAGINVLQKELKKVLSFNDSYVSPRHILLLADTMGRSGNMCGLIRQKMSSMGNGVLHQASFEQTMEVLENAAIFGHIDTLSGVTEKNMVGQPITVGTGAFDILYAKQEVEVSKRVGKIKREEEEEVNEENIQKGFKLLRKNSQMFGREYIDLQYSKNKKFKNDLFQWQQRCFVNYTLDDVQYRTCVQYGSEVVQSTEVRRGIYSSPFSETDDSVLKLTGIIHLKETEVPGTIEASTITSECFFSYITGEWKIEYIKRWTASTNVELESKLLQEPHYCIEVSLKNSQEFLERKIKTKKAIESFYSIIETL